MKKILLLSLFFFLLLSILLVTNSHAIYADVIQDRIVPSYATLLGQNNYYSVYLRGNGEAVVSFKAQFTNSGNDPVSIVVYTIPKSVTINNVVVYQISPITRFPCYPFRQSYPIERPLPLGNTDSGDSSSTDYSVTPILPLDTQTVEKPHASMPCYEGSYWFGGYGNTYQKADYQMNGNRLVITLPHSVQPNELINFFLSYRTFDYTQKNIFGVYEYKFKTLQSEQLIDSIQIGIATEQDYVFKDAKGQINYGTRAETSVIPPAIDSIKGVYNQELSSYYNRIGQGTIYKYASNLAPMESYTVDGAYADSVWKLYMNYIILGLLIFTIISLILIFIIKRIVRMTQMKTDKSSNGKDSLWGKLSHRQRALIESVAVSLLGSTCAVAYTVFIYFLSTYVMPYYGYGFELIFVMLILVVSFGVYASFLFLPALVVAVRKSISWGVATFIFTIIWLLLYLALSVLVILISSRQRLDPHPIPYSESGQSGPGKVESVQPRKNLY